MPVWVDVKYILKENPGIGEPWLRKALFHRDSNGLACAVRKSPGGRQKLLLHYERFHRWIETEGRGTAA